MFTILCIENDLKKVSSKTVNDLLKELEHRQLGWKVLNVS